MRALLAYGLAVRTGQPPNQPAHDLTADLPPTRSGGIRAILPPASLDARDRWSRCERTKCCNRSATRYEGREMRSQNPNRS